MNVHIGAWHNAYALQNMCSEWKNSKRRLCWAHREMGHGTMHMPCKTCVQSGKKRIYWTHREMGHGIMHMPCKTYVQRGKTVKYGYIGLTARRSPKVRNSHMPKKNMALFCRTSRTTHSTTVLYGPYRANTVVPVRGKVWGK